MSLREILSKTEVTPVVGLFQDNLANGHIEFQWEGKPQRFGKKRFPLIELVHDGVRWRIAEYEDMQSLASRSGEEH